MNQQQYNIKIAEYLLELCKGEEGKHLRFQQILFNEGITEFYENSNSKLRDKYNEPSSLTYKKLKING